MEVEIFLIAPLTADIDRFPAMLAEALDAAPVAALLLPRGGHEEAGYRALAEAVLPTAQPRGAAVLLDNDPGLAKTVGADGVHMSAGIKAFGEAIALLKPDMIVGAGNVHSRHDAMLKGEAGADYLFFGPLTGPADPEAADMAAWWAETFEIPAVYSNPDAGPDGGIGPNCEFIGLSDSVWAAPQGPGPALAAAAKALGLS